MSKYCIVSHPYSQKLWEQSWFYECLPYREVDGTDSYLVPEHRTTELFGRYHRFREHNERLDRLYDSNGYGPFQYRIEFPD